MFNSFWTFDRSALQWWNAFLMYFLMSFISLHGLCSPHRRHSRWTSSFLLQQLRLRELWNSGLLTAVLQGCWIHKVSVVSVHLLLVLLPHNRQDIYYLILQNQRWTFRKQSEVCKVLVPDKKNYLDWMKWWICHQVKLLELLIGCNVIKRLYWTQIYFEKSILWQTISKLKFGRTPIISYHKPPSAVCVLAVIQLLYGLWISRRYFTNLQVVMKWELSHKIASYTSFTLLSIFIVRNVQRIYSTQIYEVFMVSRLAAAS